MKLPIHENDHQESDDIQSDRESQKLHIRKPYYEFGKEDFRTL